MVLTAVRGALGFLSRLPVGHSQQAWDAFVGTPAAFPLAGYVVGGFVALPFLAAGLLPAPVVAAAYLGSVVLVTGVNHADGLADLGDAAVVHGDPETRRDVMRDTTIGVGAVLALGTVLLALALAALAVSRLPPLVAVSLVLAAEVGAKLAMATLACIGRPSHEGFGATVIDGNGPRHLVGALAVSLPAAIIAVPAATVAVLTGPLLALGLSNWADQRLGGVSGDAFGAANELTRAVALHVGVAVWSLFGGVWSIPLVDWGVLAWTLS
ncbi:adenosylcobinamide-GDP ribazoletransferase [Haloarcula marismortui]|uniref:Adenosylcobinamide-GDP ribazoletransferase n=1 Tax=Haloarcula marismortui ATCC 33800 TaxID=662476 RepID=M0K5P4_9EURY|nr:adenosylcobinamide-GDP ribazoletransferase [Haloarcula sinaiiensis]EMA15479.1 putative cobalamin-5-phosphate synthase [Haloarcula sinaiiensis ATCC 33800]QUJ72401.1 adenosylcobinamide-GDP ribazoletransferase [Haloarcula sinaiiensis ATCC 33800]